MACTDTYTCQSQIACLLYEPLYGNAVLNTRLDQSRLAWPTSPLSLRVLFEQLAICGPCWINQRVVPTLFSQHPSHLRYVLPHNGLAPPSLRFDWFLDLEIPGVALGVSQATQHLAADKLAYLSMSQGSISSLGSRARNLASSCFALSK